ncbi:hypothetical protein BDV38DRAFT_241190 [Aspergillus pseudotamarii]|uniref:Uncharacterized protein n=1 Tax=Aspergillus pseudotamarii TaxID=132259 RepID=A0A5N6SYS2_ASPPS|nr:uncharacterized protein BDV38DRAFT_241190 [Aspergillus pseudotamarii]KAE8139782.1 hypothetical protein BDV38DRAFT_241190 [Aspergillus pseudotamarii]
MCLKDSKTLDPSTLPHKAFSCHLSAPRRIMHGYRRRNFQPILLSACIQLSNVPTLLPLVAM